MCGWFLHLHLLLQSNWSTGMFLKPNAKMQMGLMGAKDSSTSLHSQIRALHDWNERAFRSDARLWGGMMFWRSTDIDVSAEGIFYKGAGLAKRLQRPRAACHHDNLIRCVRQSAAIAISTNTRNSLAYIWPSVAAKCIEMQYYSYEHDLHSVCCFTMQTSVRIHAAHLYFV